MPEPSLRVRFRTLATDHADSRVVYLYSNKDVFFVDAETIVIRIPNLSILDLQMNRIIVVEVSINDGVDWTSEEATFTFKPTPQILSLSHYSTNLRADFTLQIYGF